MTAQHTLKAPHAHELHQMSTLELRELLAKAKEDKMRIIGRNQRQVDKNMHPSGEARQNRKLIARCMTILVQRGERCV